MLDAIKSLPKMSALLLLLPVAVYLQWSGNDGLPLFVVSALAILGTVTLIGKATEEVAIYAGALWGGLLNATFGNVTELIIAMIALTKGPEMHEIVLGSIVGSILGNLLLVLGGAMVYGGMKYSTQNFSPTGARVNIGMLWVVLVALTVPSAIQLAAHIKPDALPGVTAEAADGLVGQTSIAASIILLVLYGLMLLFSLRTHRFLLRSDAEHRHQPQWSVKFAGAMLFAATACVAYLSEAFVHSIEELKHAGTLDMSEMFIGVIVVAVVGNAAEGMVAIWVARDNKMELSFQIAMGSCLQVALLVAPVLVLTSYFLGDLMPLAFDPFMLMSLAAATAVASAALNDGESNWLEGAMFLAVYFFFALVFWYHP